MPAPRRPTPRVVYALAASLVACGALPVEHEVAPAGVIRGSVVYSGPPPCTQRGHVVGSAEVLVFSSDVLPPPDGVATTALSLATVPGDVLFASVASSIPSRDDGGEACPLAGAAPVTVTAPFSVGPLAAGRYQLRAFYDYHGSFSPLLQIHNLPTAGDVVGGAITNTDAALAGAAAVFENITVGVTNASGDIVMPPSGAVVDGVTVSVGRVLSTTRPVFSWGTPIDKRPAPPSGSPLSPPLRQASAGGLTLAQDERFLTPPTANPATADDAFLRLVLEAGVPSGEVSNAVALPLALQLGNPPAFALSARRGASGTVASVPESPLIADLYPQAILAKLDASDPSRLTSQSSPAVLSTGLVLNDTLLATLAADPAWASGPKPTDHLTVALRPAVICLDPLDASSTITVVTPSFRSVDGGTVLDPRALAATVAQRFGRSASQVDVVEGCLPTGDFSVNLVYDTGQAWSVPNEAGECQIPDEAPAPAGSATPTACAQTGRPPRPVLGSQRPVVTIAGERQKGYCASKARPGVAPGGVPRACLTGPEAALLAETPTGQPP